MIVQSFILEKRKLVPVEVELTLWPGLPMIQFLGRADQHLKESALRIKSALKAQGFEFPKGQQILVNLRPSHIKKTSRGIELAVAAAYLWETEQVRRPISGKYFFVYGELGLSGQVYQPDDLNLWSGESIAVVMTGKSEQDSTSIKAQRMTLHSLNQLEQPDLVPIAQATDEKFLRPTIPDIYFSRASARLLKIAALGGHHMLLAGQAGSGKSTLAKALHYLLPQPQSNLWNQVVETQKKFSGLIDYLPLVKPHHTIPIISMVGGGSVPEAGEISRAHGGILLMDELLEFRPAILEALREPLEEGRIRVARAGRVEVFPASFQCVATTNLCPCGDFVPGSRQQNCCRYSPKKCLSYKEKLSGPLLDRFQLLSFVERQNNLAKDESLGQIFTELEEIREKVPVQEPHAQMIPASTLGSISARRRLALDSVARSMARIEIFQNTKECAELSSRQLNSIWQKSYAESFDLTILPFEKMKYWNI